MRTYLSALALDATLRLRPAAEVHELGERARAAGIVEEVGSGAIAWSQVMFPLIFADGFTLAEQMVADALDHLGERPSVVGSARVYLARSFVHLRRGALRDAIADARTGADAATADRMLNDGKDVAVSIVDEHTRDLGGLVDRNITSDDLIAELDRLAVDRGYPAVLRCDNGPELACAATADWAGERTGLHFIPPGQPWRNRYVESFNSRVRDECLNINMFWSLAQARVVISDWREDYIHRRRHSALGYQAPAVYAAARTHQ